MRILRVTGSGEASQTPDLIVFRFSIVSEGMDYDAVINSLNTRTVILRKDIMSLGFAGEDLKTVNFKVETKYQYHNGKQTFDGYRAVHDLKLEFPYNKVFLNKVVHTVSYSQADAEFHIYFEVKDKEAFKNAVLRDAVQNATESAKTIAGSSHIRLGKIVNIIYGVNELIIRSNVMLSSEMVSAEIPQLDITPQDVKSTDTITMEWEIEDII